MEGTNGLVEGTGVSVEDTEGLVERTGGSATGCITIRQACFGYPVSGDLSLYQCTHDQVVCKMLHSVTFSYTGVPHTKACTESSYDKSHRIYDSPRILFYLKHDHDSLRKIVSVTTLQ